MNKRKKERERPPPVSERCVYENNMINNASVLICMLLCIMSVVCEKGNRAI